MRAVELMEKLADAVQKNPKVNVSFMINEETIKEYNLGSMKGTNFFEIETSVLEENMVLYIKGKKDNLF